MCEMLRKTIDTIRIRRLILLPGRTTVKKNGYCQLFISYLYQHYYQRERDILTLLDFSDFYIKIKEENLLGKKKIKQFVFILNSSIWRKSNVDQKKADLPERCDRVRRTRQCRCDNRAIVAFSP